MNTMRTKTHLVFLVSAVGSRGRFRKIHQRVNLVPTEIRLHTVKVRLVLHTLSQVLAFAQDVAELVVTRGGQSIRSDDVAGLFFRINAIEKTGDRCTGKGGREGEPRVRLLPSTK